MLSTQFKVIEFNQASYILDRPYSNGIYATIDTKGYIYLFSNHEEYKLIECLNIIAIFEDPSELEDYKNCCNCESIPESCFDEDSNYPAPSFLIDTIRDELLKLFLSTKEQIKEDKENNADDQ